MQQNDERDALVSRPKRDPLKYFTLTLTRSLTVRIPLQIANTILSILSVLARVGLIASLYVYTTSLSTHKACGKDHVVTGPYFALFFTAFWFPMIYFACVLVTKLVSTGVSLRLGCSHKQVALIGFLNAINGLLIVYSSPTDRTPWFLQSILSTSIIPFTTILRFLVLRQGVSGGRLVCTFAVLVGLIISVEPSIFDLGNSSTHSKNRTASSVYWPIVFCIGFIPLALTNVLQEREVKTNCKYTTGNPDDSAMISDKRPRKIDTLLLLAWMQLYSFMFLAALFWTAFIPHIGNNNSWKDFSNHMTRGYHCHFGRGPIYNCSTSATESIVDRGTDLTATYLLVDVGFLSSCTAWQILSIS